MVRYIDERERLYHKHQRLFEAFNTLQAIFYEDRAAGQPMVSVEQALDATRRSLEETDNKLRAATHSTAPGH
ncbi:MAG TPA: hypothetical protein VJ998_10065 [Pseudomonadales bacterium]|nr:hypothetical protein [Pseudomonadales bacterium]